MARKERFEPIDPGNIWFTHSRIRPFFSGCAMRIEDTLNQLKSGEVSISDIPFITVIENDGRFYSLNNRRLFVFKSLRQLNLLPSNEITARVKQPLEREKSKYTPENCSLTATIMNERIQGAACDAVDETPSAEPPGSKVDVAPSSKSSKNVLASLPKVILKELPSLTTLVETGKSKNVNETIQKWKESYSLSADQITAIKLEIEL